MEKIVQKLSWSFDSKCKTYTVLATKEKGSQILSKTQHLNRYYFYVVFGLLGYIVCAYYSYGHMYGALLTPQFEETTIESWIGN
jgi:hypothetical protein